MELIFPYSQHLKWIRKVNQSCPKTRTCIVQNVCITLMKGFDPLQTLTVVILLKNGSINLLLSQT